jgi:hypothetical protein
MDDPDFITSTVEDDGVGSSMTDYADSSETLRVRAVAKAASDLSVPLEIDDFVDHGIGTLRPARVALNPLFTPKAKKKPNPAKDKAKRHAKCARWVMECPRPSSGSHNGDAPRNVPWAPSVLLNDKLRVPPIHA